MFEQSVLTIPRRPWTMAASLTLQCAAAGAIVLVSVISVQTLPLVSLPAPLPPLPRIPRSEVQIIAASVERSGGMVVPGTAMPRNIFREPARIPEKVAIIDDGPALLTQLSQAGSGGGIPDGVVGAFEPGIPAVKPPEPPKRVEAVKQPEAALAKPVQVGGKVQEAKLIHRVMPVYPPLARQARISGQVRLVSVISRDGTVKELKVLGGHPLLVSAAVDAVRQWVYSPTLLNGKPVEVLAPIDVNFTLTGN